MTSQTDLDQGGQKRQFSQVYLGPSIGWVRYPNNTILEISTGGTTIVAIGTTLVKLQAGSAGATIQLPSSLGNPAGAGAVPGTYLERPMTIVDADGIASSGTPITILPFGSELIDGLSSIQLTMPYGAFQLTPRVVAGGWTLTQ